MIEYTQRIIRVVGITLLLAQAFAAQAAAEDQPIEASAGELAFANASTVVQTEVRWLPLAGGNFLALQRDYLAATERGVAILLPERDTLPTANNGIEQLRTGLNDHGWTTISLMPPPRFAAKSKTENEGSENRDQIKSETESYSQRLVARLISAKKASDVIGGRLIVIAQGSQVSYLSKFYLDNMLTMPDALILLDARAQHTPEQVEEGKTVYADSQDLLSAQISKLSLRVLDIYRRQSNLAEQMAHRKKLSIKNKQYTYRQTELFGADNSHLLIKTVYGWLKSSGLN